MFTMGFAKLRFSLTATSGNWPPSVLVRGDAKTGCKNLFKKWFSDAFGVGRSDGVSGFRGGGDVIRQASGLAARGSAVFGVRWFQRLGVWKMFPKYPRGNFGNIFPTSEIWERGKEEKRSHSGVDSFSPSKRKPFHPFWRLSSCPLMSCLVASRKSRCTTSAHSRPKR